MFKSTLLVITTITLIAVAGATAVAQSRPISGQAPAAAVTIEISDLGLDSPGRMTPDGTQPVYREHGRAMTMDWLASDPRLSGAVTSVCERLVNRDGSYLEAETYLLVNDAGRWVGESTGRFLRQPDADLVIGSGLLPTAPDHADVIVFRGEDGYTGLSAVVDVDWSQDPPLAGAAIFAAEPPTAPVLSAR